MDIAFLEQGDVQQMNALQAETQLEKVNDVIGGVARRRRLGFADP